MEFATWYVGMKKDRRVKASLNRRLERVKNGLLGDVEPVGEGVARTGDLIPGANP